MGVHIVSTVIGAVIGIWFIFIAIGALTGAKKALENFDHLRLPTWFRYLTGIVQLIGGISMILGIWSHTVAIFAGLWIGATMVVAVLLHIREREPFKASVPAIIVFLLAMIVL
jgi:putative oxidoreductase